MRRQQIETALDREIVAVDDRDTYVCRPHAPGEIAAALIGHQLTKALRRGKFLWAETDDGPELGLHLGMAGQSSIDEEPHARWDRFTLHFADGGRLALRDRRRLGRALIEPDFDHVGPDAAAHHARRVPQARRQGLMRAEGPPARPEGARRASATCSPTRRSGRPASNPRTPPGSSPTEELDHLLRVMLRAATRARSPRAASTPATSSPTASAGAVPALRDDASNAPRSAVARPSGAPTVNNERSPPIIGR